MGKQLYRIVCPVCGMSRPLKKTRIKDSAKGKIVNDVGKAQFDLQDPETSPFVEIREAGGRCKRGETDINKIKSWGFRRVGFVTMFQAIDSGEYDEFIDQIERQVNKVAEAIQKRKSVK